MYKLIKPKLKDPERMFGPLEREIIYYSDRKKGQLQRCNSDVLWADAEVHHIEQHSNGGKTNLADGALVHKSCHPKSQKDVAAFAEAWKSKGNAAGA
jgi:5-methylcytosine-specific restriction endonuclease McrA